MAGGLQGRRFHIRTFGCQMNVSDSEHMAGLLVREGAVPAPTPESCDILIVNTCAVRAKSEEKLYSFLGRMAKIKTARGMTIIVAGCVAEIRSSEMRTSRPFIDGFLGPGRIHELPGLLKDVESSPSLRTGTPTEWIETPESPILRESPFAAFVTVMEGCDNFCAYCIVPFSRGRERFRPLASILREVESLGREGFAEIQLLGQNVNSYRDPETGIGFSGLLRAVAGSVDIPWIRFLTSHPKNFTRDIAETMAAEPRICRHIHLPLQSGSTSVLKRMKRGYTREDYLSLAALLRDLMPGLELSTDIIVGFPGENDADFSETLDVIRNLRFVNIFSFRYSPRPGTAAARVKDDVPAEVKQNRLLELQAEQKRIQLEKNAGLVGRTVRVLVEGPSRRGPQDVSGRTEAHQVVNFAAGDTTAGRFVDVAVTSAGPYSLRGKIVGPPVGS